MNHKLAQLLVQNLGNRCYSCPLSSFGDENADIHIMRSFYILREETAHKPSALEVTDDSEFRFGLEADESKIVRKKKKGHLPGLGKFTENIT
jgi:hypothetical protein